MRLVYGRDQEVAAWVTAQIPHAHSFGPMVALGVETDQGQLVGGVVFNNWRPHYKSAEISAASVSRKWLTKPVLTGIFNYPFVQLGCNRLTAATPRSAHLARKFLEDFGFQPEGIVRLGFGTEDGLLFGLLASEWATHRCNLGRVLDEGLPHTAARA